jgi:glyoxylase-like metal-dependent hydrolase (beta-lactamase superfamily II)
MGPEQDQMERTPPALRWTVVPVTSFEQNCSIVWCPGTSHGAVIDPGGDLDCILMAAEAENVCIEQILITHPHADHAGGAAELADRLAIPIQGPHRDDQFWIDRLGGPAHRAIAQAARAYVPDRWLTDGDRVAIGATEVEVIHCPGHTPGHVVYFHAGARVAFVGDILFRGRIGSTRLPLGDHIALLGSILGRIWPLGEDVTIVPGHGPLTTIGHERRTNPFVSDGAMAPYRVALEQTAPALFRRDERTSG